MMTLTTLFSSWRLLPLGLAMSWLIGGLWASPTPLNLADAHRQLLTGYDCLLKDYNPLALKGDTMMFFTAENIDQYRNCPAYPTLRAWFDQGATEVATLNRNALYIIEKESSFLVAKRQSILLYVHSGRPSEIAANLDMKNLERVGPGLFRGSRVIW